MKNASVKVGDRLVKSRSRSLLDGWPWRRRCPQPQAVLLGIDLKRRVSLELGEPLLGKAGYSLEAADLVPPVIAEPVDDRVVDLGPHRHRETHPPLLDGGQYRALQK